MIRRTTSIIIFLIAALASLQAKPVDKKVALQSAKDFLFSKGIDMQLETEATVQARRGKEAQLGSYYYLFNSTNNNGFVLVAGDDCINPILGYSDNGNISPDNIPDGLQAILDLYSHAIDDLSEREALGIDNDGANRPRHTMSVAREPINPFLTKHWGHRDPYNAQNPSVNDTVCLTGCATVALAEVMGYYEYPQISPLVKGYTTSTRKIQLEDLDPTTLEWQDMITNYLSYSYTTEQKEAVAKMMRYVGQHLKSDYQTVSTGAPTTNMPKTLQAFGYNSSPVSSLSSKTMNEWEDIIYNNMLKRSPVIICANNINKDGTHAFIIDGYDKDDFFHIDWGWNATGNGFYSFSKLSPYDNTATYSYMRDLSIIFNIEPSETYEQTSSITPYSCLETQAISVDELGDITITRKNLFGRTLKYKHGIAIVDEYSKLVRVLDYDTLSYKSYEVVTRNWNMYDLSGLRHGSFRIYPVSQLEDGDGNWHFDKSTGTNSYIAVEMDNDEYTLSDGPAIVYNSVSCDSTLGFVSGSPRIIKLNMTNNSMDKLKKYLYMFEDNKPAMFNLTNIPPNTTADVDFYYSPSSPGTHDIVISTDVNRKNVIHSSTIEAEDSVHYALSFNYTIDNYDKTDRKLFGNEIHAHIKVTNRGNVDYHDYMRPLLIETSWHTTKLLYLHIPKGKSVTFDFDVYNLVYGNNYTFRIYYKKCSGNDNLQLNRNMALNFAIKPRRGICTWDKDGHLTAIEPSTEVFVMPEDAVALDLTGNSTVPSDIVPNSNPNTLYYVTKRYESLNGLNQIIKGVADSISFTDSIPCYVPADFKADSVSYIRTFDKGFTGKRNGSNWTTLALPFTVDKVFNTVDSVEIDWRHPTDEVAKDFWVRRFFGQEGMTAYFTDADRIEANKPYIITVPSDYKGEEFNLVGKPLLFSATNADIIKSKVFADTDNYDFIGSFKTTKPDGQYIYLLDEEVGGNNFVYHEDNTTMVPFRAYFTSETPPREGSMLYVSSYIYVPETDAISAVAVDNGQSKKTMPSQKILGVYSITGRKLAEATNVSPREILQQLPSGIYIINGKKYVK